MANEEKRRDVLRGNFKPQKSVTIPDESQDLRTKFEGEALKRLGGSIAFVSGKKFIYGAKRQEDKGSA